MQRYLKVLYIEPNKLPTPITIKNNLKEKQILVGGKIQYHYLPNITDIVLVCNENGKNLNLPINRDIDYDTINGNFFIVGDDYIHGEDRSLTNEQIQKYSKMFSKYFIEYENSKSDNFELN